MDMAIAEGSDGPGTSSDLKRVLDAMKMGVVLLDADLIVEIVNNEFYEIWNVSPQDVGAGSPFQALLEISRYDGVYEVADENWDGYLAGRLAEIRAGDVAPREFVRADGCTMIYSVTALSGGKRLVSYYDVSEMKRPRAAAWPRCWKRRGWPRR